MPYMIEVCDPEELRRLGWLQRHMWLSPWLQGQLLTLAKPGEIPEATIERILLNVVDMIEDGIMDREDFEN